MRRRRLLLLLAALVVAGAIVVVLFLPAPAPPNSEPPQPAPVVKPPPSPLQADAQGTYVPTYRFTLNRFRFTGFSLHPDAFVTLAEPASGSEQSVGCVEAQITAHALHLRCDDPQVGTVTIDGTFLTRLVTHRLDAAVVSAVVTVRSGSGEILYRAREQFTWQPSD